MSNDETIIEVPKAATDRDQFMEKVDYDRREQKFTGSVILETGGEDIQIARFFSLLECLSKFKRENGLMGFFTMFDDTEQYVKFGFCKKEGEGEIVLQWFQQHFILEYKGLNRKHYRSLRSCYSRYWKRNRYSTTFLRDKLKLQGFAE